MNDPIQVYLLCAAILGLGLTFLQLHSGRRQKAAETIIELHNQYYADHDITDIYYLIEYESFEFDRSQFHMSEEEKKLDKLLNHFDNIGKLHQLSNLSIEDLEYVAYRYLRVYQDKSVCAYLEFLDGWYSDRGLKVKPYASFRAVGKLLEVKYYREA